VKKKPNNTIIPEETATIFELFVEVSITYTLSANAFLQVLPHEMTLAQFKLLSHFSKTKTSRTSIIDLAHLFQVSKPSMGETVSKLRKKSFVKVESNPSDQREKLVSITPEGEAARIDAIQAFSPLMQRMLTEIGVKQFEDSIQVLRPICRWLDENRMNSSHPSKSKKSRLEDE
jgi:DNA-binding MarR family transcriptional regulator